MHTPVVHALVHVRRVLPRDACLRAVWFVVHVGGDLLSSGLSIVICVCALLLCFLFLLVCSLNLFKLTTRETDSDVLWFVQLCQTVMFVHSHLSNFTNHLCRLV